MSPRYDFYPLPGPEGVQDTIDADEEAFTLVMVLKASVAIKQS